jgi:hypothetical protein
MSRETTRATPGAETPRELAHRCAFSLCHGDDHAISCDRVTAAIAARDASHAALLEQLRDWAWNAAAQALLNSAEAGLGGEVRVFAAQRAKRDAFIEVAGLIDRALAEGK